jgi:hypothetical protein
LGGCPTNYLVYPNLSCFEFGCANYFVKSYNLRNFFENQVEGEDAIDTQKLYLSVCIYLTTFFTTKEEYWDIINQYHLFIFDLKIMKLYLLCSNTFP